MLKGAMAELEVGDTRKLSTDVGPVITAEARDAIKAHVDPESPVSEQNFVSTIGAHCHVGVRHGHSLLVNQLL